MTPISAFALDWHVSRKSSAFYDLLITPLQPPLEIQLKPQSELMTHDLAKPVIFCQIPPPCEWLANPDAKLVWIPMWDNVRMRRQNWWDQLPKHLRIVAFSQAVAHRARQAGLTVLQLQYYKDPRTFGPTNWSGQRVLFYWNRTGLFSREFLQQLCTTLEVDQLLVRENLDPGTPSEARFSWPSRLKNTSVKVIDEALNQEAYLRLLQQAHLYLAPRLFEGVGMSFLEAMASGCCVLAHNGATMNEYIRHGQNGVLFSRPWSMHRLRRAIQARLARLHAMPHPKFEAPIPMEQDWGELSQLDVVQMGHRARQDHQRGFEHWTHQLDEYRRFITDW